MSNSRELISLQVGHFSNYIGSHWWNLQEASFVYDKNQSTDINHDFLFRETKSSTNQELYTPRLLIIDKKGSLGSLSLQGNLQETKSVVQGLTTDQASWNGEVEIVHQLKDEKNEYLQFLEDEENKYLEGFDEDKDICLDAASDMDVDKDAGLQKSFNISDKVKVWSDFLRPYLHTDSIYCLKDVWHHDPIDLKGFQSGEELMSKEEPLDETINRIRKLAESCSSLQGFQMLADGYNEMGGVSLAVAKHLEDDYRSKDVFSFVSSLPNPPKTVQDLALYATSIVQSYTELSKVSSMMVPLNLGDTFWKLNSETVQFPHAFYQSENNYEASSLLACFMETITIPYRRKASPLPMNDFSYLVTPLQRKIACGSLALPLGLHDDSTLFSMFTKDQDFSYCSVSGNIDYSMGIVAEHRVIRGIPTSIVNSRDGYRYRDANKNSWTLYSEFLEETNSKLRYVTGISDPLKVSSPFPQIFRPTVNEYGFLKTKEPYEQNVVKSTPAAAMLSQCNGVGIFLNNLLEDVKNINVAKIPRLIEEDLDKERWNDILEDLRSYVQQYNLPESDHSSGYSD